jgi:serine/threonine protein kinase
MFLLLLLILVIYIKCTILRYKRSVRAHAHRGFQGFFSIFMLIFQYGLPADIYSLSIIFFELFSGETPFPGDVCQILGAKMRDVRPAMPEDFPSELKELVSQGYSKEPTERPKLLHFQSALNKML